MRPSIYALLEVPVVGIQSFGSTTVGAKVVNRLLTTTKSRTDYDAARAVGREC